MIDVPPSGPLPLNIDALLAREFPLEPHLIYLNHAAVAPWPQRVADAVSRFAEDNSRHGATHYPRWQQVEKTLRSQCAQLINAASPDDIALLKNTSEGLSVVAHGFPWNAGDNVVTSDEEFPSNHIVWDSLIDRGVQVRKVRLRDTSDPEQALVDSADRRTRLLSISSVQYASGLRMDLTKLGKLCHARGIAFCVDAIQGLGVFPHDVRAMHIDFLAADAHKWLLGPEGIALFYCRPEWRERLALHQYGWHMVEAVGDYSRTDWQPAVSARRFECGSPNMLGIHAFSASLSLLLDIGMESIERRVLERTGYLFDLIAEQPTLTPITARAPGRYAAIVTLRHREHSPVELHARLQAHRVACVPRGGGVRFSPHFYTPLGQLEQAVALCVA
jgi:cysteine desulfurase / selenocysteine lyase